MHVQTLRLRPVQRGQRTVRAAHVSMFWSEKAALLVWWAQMHGLLWVLAVNWPFPQQWLSGMEFTLIFNLDLPPLLKAHELTYPIPIHCAMLLSVPLWLGAAAWLFHRRIQERGDSMQLKLATALRMLFALGAVPDLSRFSLSLLLLLKID